MAKPPLADVAPEPSLIVNPPPELSTDRAIPDDSSCEETVPWVPPNVRVSPDTKLLKVSDIAESTLFGFA